MKETSAKSGMCRVVSCNVGLPCEIEIPGGAVQTGIFKKSIAGKLAVTRSNMAGDGQADLSVHGGPYKAVYVYPSEHYAFWEKQLGEADLTWGAFGENLTSAGLDEESTSIGDQLGIGSVLFQVTQPRLPCYKLGLKFGRMDIVKLFRETDRSGFYLSVLEPGEVEASDTINIIPAKPPAIRVRELLSLYRDRGADREVVGRALQSQWLTADWKDYLHKRYG